MEMVGKLVGISRKGKFEPGTKIRQKAANFEPVGVPAAAGNDGNENKRLTCGGILVFGHGFAADTRLGIFERVGP